MTSLLALVRAEPGLSAARACKRLGWSRSELQRVLAALGPDSACGGADLVRVQEDGGRDTLWPLP